MTPKTEKSVRVRFAPSPTGPFHLGGARTALFNWIFARQMGGKFVLRIEDTDVERSKKEHEKGIIDSLVWLGLNWDEGPDVGGDYGPYRQSERLDIYEKYLKQLLESGKAYYCYCSKEELEAQREAMIAQGIPPKYTGRCRNLTAPPEGKSVQLIRFKTPEVKVEFKDVIRGTVEFDAALFGDIPVAKNLREPLYNFAVVVDDEEMKITHVIRGEDHLSNTPKQILFGRALGFSEPSFAHLPLILAADRSKLSKRYAETSLVEYERQGYLPEAMINFLILLGWHPKGDREMFSIEELIETFDLKRVQKAGAIWNEEKLLWLNGEHIKNAESSRLAGLILPMIKEKIPDVDEAFLAKVVDVEKGRLKTLNDFLNFASFYFEVPVYEWGMLIWNKEPEEKIKAVLDETKSELEKIDGELFGKTAISEVLEKLAVKHSKGLVFWPLRVALSGQKFSSDPVSIALVLGKDETIRRIDKAVKKLP